jgi:phospholipid/cholesterol/gamma-HCH transport system ATP-binding protein
MANGNCVIEVKGLYTRFGSHLVHENINLCVQRGEVLALVGGSGAGKTALMRQMLGLETPAQGTVHVFGEPLHGHDRPKLQSMRRCGVLFQKGALFSALSVYDNIALPMRELHTLDEDMIRDLVMLKLKMVDIAAQHATKMPAELSGGMIKRIALARATALDPELLFLDEPTAGLDPVSSEILKEKIISQKQKGKLILITSHILSDLEDITTEVIYLQEGKLKFHKSLQQLKEDTGEEKLTRAIAQVMKLNLHP